MKDSASPGIESTWIIPPLNPYPTQGEQNPWKPQDNATYPWEPHNPWKLPDNFPYPHPSIGDRARWIPPYNPPTRIYPIPGAPTVDDTMKIAILARHDIDTQQLKTRLEKAEARIAELEKQTNTKFVVTPHDAEPGTVSGAQDNAKQVDSLNNKIRHLQAGVDALAIENSVLLKQLSNLEKVTQQSALAKELQAAKDANSVMGKFLDEAQYQVDDFARRLRQARCQE